MGCVTQKIILPLSMMGKRAPDKLAGKGEDELPSRVSVAIMPDVHSKFRDVCKGRSVSRSMNDAASRVIEWFCKQDAIVQTAITNDIDKGMEHAYAEALRKMADELDHPEPPPGLRTTAR